MTFSLRAADQDDADDISHIWHTGWIDGHLGHVDAALIEARTSSSFRHRVLGRLPRTVVAVHNESGAVSIAGFVMVLDNEVEQISVANAHRGSRCADQLLSNGEQQIAAAGHRVAWLAVISANNRARRFYDKRGWTDSGPIRYLAASADGVPGQIPVEALRYEKPVSGNRAEITRPPRF